MDNLQSITYQTFEKDPVKYKNYEEAIYHALMDWPERDRMFVPRLSLPTSPTKLFFVA
jgi:protein arginine N-methyltransferase 5